MLNNLESSKKSRFSEALNYKVSLYFMGIASITASIVTTIYEINEKIFIHSAIIPDKSFVFSIACIIFSLSLIIGVHRERLDYVTPYFMTCITLMGYFVTVVLLDISKWNNVKHPKSTLLFSIFGLFLTSSSVYILYKFMEKLKEDMRSRDASEHLMTQVQ